MIIISHRGNLHGPNPTTENTKAGIIVAAERGFVVEADVWRIGKDFFLGHDKPMRKRALDYEVAPTKLILHVKNAIAPIESCVYDNFCLEGVGKTWTRNGYLWMSYVMTYVDEDPVRQAIPAHCPEMTIACSPEVDGCSEEPLEEFVKRCMELDIYGICTDYPLRVREIAHGG